MSDLTGAPEIGGVLLDEAQGYANVLGDADRANLTEMRRLYAHRAAVPTALVVERARVSQALQAAWLDAKTTSDLGRLRARFQEADGDLPRGRRRQKRGAGSRGV